MLTTPVKALVLSFWFLIQIEEAMKGKPEIHGPDLLETS